MVSEESSLDFGERVALILRKVFGSSLKFCDFKEREFWPLRGIFNSPDMPGFSLDQIP